MMTWGIASEPSAPAALRTVALECACTVLLHHSMQRTYCSWWNAVRARYLLAADHEGYLECVSTLHLLLLRKVMRGLNQPRLAGVPLSNMATWWEVWANSWAGLCASCPCQHGPHMVHHTEVDAVRWPSNSLKCISWVTNMRVQQA
jgi:hypothetical protein